MTWNRWRLRCADLYVEQEDELRERDKKEPSRFCLFALDAVLVLKETANGLEAEVSPQTAKPHNDLVLCDCDCQGESKHFLVHQARASNDMATPVLSEPYLRPLDRCSERISLLKVESSCCCSRTGRSRAVTASRKIILFTAILDGQPKALPRSGRNLSRENPGYVRTQSPLVLAW
jgi:hypothetical protein